MASRLQDVIARGIRADQPIATAVAAGTLYFVTDEGVTERSTGLAWESYSGAGSGGSGGAAQTSFLVSGGQVVWIENYEFLVSAATYYIGGTAYASPETTITLDAADPTNDRIDTIAVNSVQHRGEGHRHRRRAAVRARHRSRHAAQTRAGVGRGRRRPNRRT